MFQPQQSRKLSLSTLALIFIPLGMALYGLWHFHIEPFYTLLTPLNPIFEGARNIEQTFIPAITDYVIKNPLTVLTATITIGGVIGGKLLQNHYENQKAQLQTQAEQAITDNIKLSQAYTKLEQEQIELQQKYTNMTQNNSQDALLESQRLLQEQKTEFNLERANLLGQIERLSKELENAKVNVVIKEVVK